jgi:competence protein ComEC
MLFDAGPQGATRCQAAVRELVPGRRLDLVVLSHSDKDHIGMVKSILGLRPPPNQTERENLAAVIIHSGDPRGELATSMRAFITEQAALGAQVFDLYQIDHPDPSLPPPIPVRPGDSFPVGTGRATFIAGWSDGNLTQGPTDKRLPDDAARNNVLSIVIRFEYGGHSVLLTGDTLGRRDRDGDDACFYAERIMSERTATVPIESEVLIGQHHGANNSTSTCFIQAVKPEYVIFAAGHQYHHPREKTVKRLLAAGVPIERILRTDFGDNEGGTEMIEYSGTCKDKPGDDDVEIRLPDDPAVPIDVDYTGTSRPCPP